MPESLTEILESTKPPICHEAEPGIIRAIKAGNTIVARVPGGELLVKLGRFDESETYGVCVQGDNSSDWQIGTFYSFDTNIKDELHNAYSNGHKQVPITGGICWQGRELWAHYLPEVADKTNLPSTPEDVLRFFQEHAYNLKNS